MTSMFCIFCEKTVLVEHPVEGHTVLEFIPDEGMQEVCFCEGPFAGCEPDEYDPDFDLNLEEPSSTEIYQINLTAKQLLLDLEGE